MVRLGYTYKKTIKADDKIATVQKMKREIGSVSRKRALDRRTFEAYMEKFLAPNMHPNDIVLMVNLNVHKSVRVEEMMASRGAKCMFLQEYIPHLNPREKMWSEVKQILRGIKPRSHQQLDEAIGTALDIVIPADAKGWFESCRYV